MAQHTHPDDATRDEERREAQQAHETGRGPTAEESAAADRGGADPSVAGHEREMTERGARQQGEGRLP